MIAHLNGTAGLGALDKKNAEQKWAALNGECDYPDREHVARFGELTKRMCSANRQLEQAGPPIEMPRAILRSLWHLNSLRNDFIHFSPKGWSLEMSGLPKMIDACVVVFRGVLSGGWLYHLEEEETAEYGETIDQIEKVGQTIFV
jgi:hypothetical protein